MIRLAVLVWLVLLVRACAPTATGDPAGPASSLPPSTVATTQATTTGPASSELPAVCGEVPPLYPDALDLPPRSEIAAQFPFADGVVVLVREDQPTATYFSVVECFTGGGGGFVGGGPGETWQGHSRVDYSDSGYAIVIVDDPSWTVRVEGRPVELVPAGDVGAGLVAGFFDRPPTVEITGYGGSAG
jgi:hypothetical protein